MNIRLKQIAGGTVTTPKGFLAGTACAGIKTTGEPDLGVLYSEAPCAAAGVFTTNRIKAAPVILSQKHLVERKAQAIVANSGCANACCGEQGLADAAEMASLTARKLGLSPDEVLVASTGVIGAGLPMELIEAGVEEIALSKEGGHGLAKAILTTDTRPKEIAVEVSGGEFTIGGIAKGAGMIHPNLATMLCFLTTDAKVNPDFLQVALQKAVDDSFNMITIDGDTSPNDMVLMLANGLSGNETFEAELFQAALEEVCIYLARCIASDGEGATRLIEVSIEGALTRADARAAARTIAGSSLVKTAIHGSDPNWGRIIAALGNSGAEIVESRIGLHLNNICLMESGCPLPFDEGKVRAALRGTEVPIRLNLNLGSEKATAWGCDLSEEYVTINSAYTT